MSLRTTVDPANEIGKTYHKIPTTISIPPFGTLVGNRTIVTSEWILLTESIAKAYCDSHAFDTNTSYHAEQYDAIFDAWKIVKSVDSQGPFTWM